MMKIDSNHLRGHLETMILSVLAESPAHGFEILQRLEARSEGSLKLKEGSLYPALYRLEEAGSVAAQWEGENPERKRGPRRRIYHLTDQGRKELDTQRQGWRHFVAVIGGIVEAGA